MESIKASAKDIVAQFLADVRSGKNPEYADKYMAETVLAHQFNAESPNTVLRTPQDYTNHIRDFINTFGNFKFALLELIAEGDKVYARWVQHGLHLQSLDGFPATGKPLVEYTSAVYRIADGKIVEYWLQTDRMGMHLQLMHNKKDEENIG